MDPQTDESGVFSFLSTRRNQRPSNVYRRRAFDDFPFGDYIRRISLLKFVE